MNHNIFLLLCALFAVCGLIALIARFKFNAFVALILASVFVAVASAMDLPEGEALRHLQASGQAFAVGVGNVLGSIAMVVGLGTILGKLLAESGGAEVIARRLLSRPERRIMSRLYSAVQPYSRKLTKQHEVHSITIYSSTAIV